MSDIRAWSVEASGYAQWLRFKRPGEKLLSDQAPEPLPWLEDFWQQTLMAPIALPSNSLDAFKEYVAEQDPRSSAICPRACYESVFSSI